MTASKALARALEQAAGRVVDTLSLEGRGLHDFYTDNSRLLKIADGNIRTTDNVAGRSLRFDFDPTPPGRFLRDMTFSDPERFGDGRGNTFILLGEDGKHYIAKPDSYVSSVRHKGFPNVAGARTAREVAAYRVDQ